jgi:hypothetical protein
MNRDVSSVIEPVTQQQQQQQQQQHAVMLASRCINSANTTSLTVAVWSSSR